LIIKNANFNQFKTQFLPNCYNRIEFNPFLIGIFSELEYPLEEWTFLNFEQILTSRQTHFKITKNHNLMVGKMQSQID
jgi:hypothetical protein